MLSPGFLFGGGRMISPGFLFGGGRMISPCLNPH